MENKWIDHLFSRYFMFVQENEDEFDLKTYRKLKKDIEKASYEHNYKRVHHLTCKILFHMAELGETLWIRLEEVMNTEEIGNKNLDLEEERTIEVSIITQSIMDYDQRMFGNMMEYTDSFNREENYHYRSTDQEIEDMLVTQFHDVYFDEARVYNVGNGNCVYLHGGDWYQKKRLLFDIGYHVKGIPPRNPKGKKREEATRAIRNFRPDCIVLSHWDSDHYMGCAYASHRIFNCTWIAPNCYDASPNARRLAKYLMIKNKLLLVARGNGRIIADIQGYYGYFKLWMGSKVSNVIEDKGITKANKEGLVIEVENNGIQAIMMGDVPYQSLPAQLNFANNNPFDYLIAPHHGAYMNFNLIKQNSYVNLNLALICAERGVNRPHKDHNTALTQSGYTVKLTDEANLRIDLDLTRRYNFVIRN